MEYLLAITKSIFDRNIKINYNRFITINIEQIITNRINLDKLFTTENKDIHNVDINKDNYLNYLIDNLNNYTKKDIVNYLSKLRDVLK